MTRFGKILAVSALIAAPLAVTAIPAQPANAQVVVSPGYGYAPYGYGAPYACGPYNPYYCPGYASGYGYGYGYGYPYYGVGLGWGGWGGWGGHGGYGHFGRGGGRGGRGGGGGHRGHR